MATGKLSLLQVVQKTLEALGSDQINSINDSTEAQQIAELAEDAYYELLNMNNWPFLHELIQLESIADSDRPNYLRIPDNVVRILQVKYNFTDVMDNPDLLLIRNIPYVDPADFLNRVQGRNTEQDNIFITEGFNGIKIPIFTDTEASIWTSFDDEYVVFDAYQDDQESTMQGINSQCLAKVIPVFNKVDDFIPKATTQFYQTWLAEVKKTAYIYFRQERSPVDEQKAARGLAVLRRDESRTRINDGKVHFGRPARGGGINRFGDPAIWTTYGRC